MDAWVAENPPARTTWSSSGRSRPVAGRIACRARRPRRRSPSTARASELDVQPGAAVTLSLTPAQAAGASVEPVSGQVLVVTTRSVPLDPSSLTAAAGPEAHADREARAADRRDRHGRRDVPRRPRARRPGRVLAADRRGPVRARADHRQPRTPRRAGDGSDLGRRPAGDVLRPERNPKRPVQEIRYVARVVDPGTYAWEPAVLQSSMVPEQGIVTPAATLVIEGSGD